MGFRRRYHWTCFRPVCLPNINRYCLRALTLHRILIGYVLAYVMFLIVIWRDFKVKRAHPEKFTPESRLWFLLFSKFSYSILLGDPNSCLA